jgi:hypothetical protein
MPDQKESAAGYFGSDPMYSRIDVVVSVLLGLGVRTRCPLIMDSWGCLHIYRGEYRPRVLGVTLVGSSIWRN